MKKIALIFLSLQLMTGNMFAEEIAKFPMLVLHFFEHQHNEHPSLSFTSYMYEHYIDCEHSDEGDSHCNEKLPFKHCHDCCTHQSIAAAFTIPDCTIKINSTQSKSVTRSILCFTYVAHSMNGIWQPPKVNS